MDTLNSDPVAAQPPAKPVTGTGAGGFMLKGLYASMDNQDAIVVAKAAGTALGGGLMVAAIGAGLWAIGAPGAPRTLVGESAAFLAAAAAALLWAAACGAAGGGVGFLFGIPRSLSSEAQPPAPAVPDPKDAGLDPASTGKSDAPKKKPSTGVNTNLEQISDWLTKIIVGVTLVELKTVVRQLEEAAKLIAASLGGPTRLSFAYSLMMYFFVAGFLGSYLLTRLYLQAALERADDNLANH